MISQEKAPDPAGHSANAEGSGVGAQRLNPDVSCWPSMTQQPSGLTALKLQLQAGQTSYGTSVPMESHEELLYFVTSGRKRNVRKWGPGRAGLETPASGRCPGFQARPACPAAYSNPGSLLSSQASQGGKQGGGWGTPWQGPLCLLWSGGLGGYESESHDHGHNRGIPSCCHPFHCQQTGWRRFLRV